MIGTQIQHYRIISELGEGGMGKVFKAFDTKLERFVAIKFLSPNLLKDSLFLERFKNEGKNHAKLSHPNIVMVYGFIEYRDLIGLIIEYVDGITIEKLIEKYKRLNVIYSLKIIRQVLIALEYAHSKGLIHRDIKPSNIIIDNNGVAKLMDFGISKSLDSKIELTRPGRNLGTILYMSPEQINNQPTTVRTDLYSLGITLYEMLNGAPPYYFSNEFKIYEAHLKNVPQKLSSKFPDVPPEIDELILSAMNKSTVVNFNSATEFCKKVEELIFSLPIKINQVSYNASDEKREEKKINRNILVPILFTIILLSFASLIYLFVQNYLPRNGEKLEEQTINFNTLRPTTKTEWRKIEIPNSSNLIDMTILNDKIYTIDDNQRAYLIDENSEVKILTNSLFEGINKILSYNNLLILLANNGNILITDKDLNIIKSINVSEKSILSADILNKQVIFCGSDGLVGKLNVESYNYSIMSNVHSTDYLDIKFLNSNKIILVGIDGSILISENAGKDWSREKLSNNYLKKIAIHPNKSQILVSAGGGAIFSSIDGGKSWTQIQLNITSPVNDFYIFDLKNYYAISSSGDIIYSTDGGSSWNVQRTGYFVPLNRISSDGKNLFIIGNNGLLIKKGL